MNDALRNSELLPLIRAQVRKNLMFSPAYNQLPPEKRAEIAYHTVNAMHYILGGADGNTRPEAVTVVGPAPIARELAEQQKRYDPAGDTASSRFAESGAVAAQQGAEALADLVNRVDFPSFVAGLIDGVFNAIVHSSIKQMEAYGELVKNVSKSVDQYMKDNVTENNARDYLTERYPNHLELDIDGEKPRLRAREGRNEDEMPDFAGDLGLRNPVTSLDDDAIEKEIVPAARRRIALDRQQLLATMVMMGVNRLVVTKGTIEASVLFELSTRDEVKRKFAQKTTSDWERQQNRQWERGGGWFSSWYSKGTVQDTAKFNVTTTRSEDSTAKVDLHAKLGGKVNVEFKSDYFPMEKMIDVYQINQVRSKTPTGTQPAQAGAPANAPVTPSREVASVRS
jgi:hypothetical protein